MTARVIITRCIVSTCGVEVRLAPDEVALEGDWFRFQCRYCGITNIKRADARHRMMLLAAGVRFREKHPEPHPQGAPAITHDDVLDFARDLYVRRDIAHWAAVEVGL